MQVDERILAQTLKRYFGYDSFRTGQETLIRAILEGRDTLGIMPTGAGKSICFQLPALLLPGITLVISPLISLMKDQVGALVQAGIPVAYINSSLSAGQMQTVYARASQGNYKIIYVAPERLLAPDFIDFAQQVEISMITVDEAHSISQWGQDFRPSYLKIPGFLQYLPNRPILSAFTATATERVKWDIIEQLHQHDPQTLVTGFDRENLYFSVQTPGDKMTALRAFLEERREKSGIIYCTTRKVVEAVCDSLNTLGYQATRYHAGLSPNERQKNQDDFRFDNKRIMVATNAFGMGIDKANVAFVVHYNLPKDMESYYQEAGRAGRDGSPAECMLLFASQDIVTNQWMITHGNDRQDMDDTVRTQLEQQELRRLRHMAGYATTTTCLRNYILQYFGETPETPCARCGNCNTVFATRDITVDAQKIFSCLYRMKRPFGATMVVDVLRGSNNANVKKWGFETLSTFGICKQSVAELRNIIDYLVVKGYILRSDDTYPTLRLAQSAMPIIKGEQTLEMAYVEKAPKKKAGKVKWDALPTDRQPLYHILRERRAQLAQQAGVPAYVIFADRTLQQMCIDLPTTEEQFLMLSGVGEAKLQRFGQAFLEEIRAFVSNPVAPLEEISVEKPKPKPKRQAEPLALPNAEICAQLQPFPEAISLSDYCRAMNEVLEENDCSRLIAPRVAKWMTEQGYLHMESAEQGRTRVPTDQGRALGILQQVREGANGSYMVNLYDKRAQRYLCEHIREILEVTQ